MIHPTNKIWLLSGPIHSGKTSALIEFAQQHSRPGGFLCPDIDGKRHLLNLHSHQLHPFQIDTPISEQDICIGKYVFSSNTFQIAHTILNSAADQQCSYFIIDEIGKLELDKKGLEPALSKALSVLKNTRLILVVRDYLLKDVIAHYKLDNADIITINDLNQICSE